MIAQRLIRGRVGFKKIRRQVVRRHKERHILAFDPGPSLQLARMLLWILRRVPACQSIHFEFHVAPQEIEQEASKKVSFAKASGFAGALSYGP